MEISTFTRQLLTDLKSQFNAPRVDAGGMRVASELLGLTAAQQQQVQTTCSNNKDEAWGLSMLLARNQSASYEPEGCGRVSDECLLFTHIVDCVKALMEVTEGAKKSTDNHNKDNNKDKDKDSSSGSVLYAGFLAQIERVVRDLVTPESALFARTSTSPANLSLNRCIAAVHTLHALPSLTQPEPDQANARKLPLLHFAAYNGQALDVVKAVYFAHPGGITARDKTGALPLHWAILNKQVSSQHRHYQRATLTLTGVSVMQAASRVSHQLL